MEYTKYLSIVYKTFNFCFTDELLSKIDFSNVSFDYFFAKGYDFSKLHGVKINPKKVFDRDLSCCILDGVTFNGSFNGANVHSSNFTGSKCAKIDIRKIDYSDDTDFTNVDILYCSNNLKDSIKVRKKLKIKNK